MKRKMLEKVNQIGTWKSTNVANGKILQKIIRIKSLKLNL